MKAKGATLNTHIISTPALVVSLNGRKKQTAQVRFTSEENGESISVQLAGENRMIVMAYEPIARLITEARQERSRKN